MDLSSASGKLVENGPIAIIQYLNERWNDNIRLEMDKVKNEDMQYNDVIIEGIKIRLKNIQPYIDHWHEAIAWMSHPTNLAFAHRTMLDYVGNVLQAAGDTSVGMDWYYKRYKLMGILVATELFMITDKSHDFTETYAFLRRSVEHLDAVDSHLHQFALSLEGLFIAKQSIFESFKPPVVKREAQEAKDALRKEANATNSSSSNSSS